MSGNFLKVIAVSEAVKIAEGIVPVIDSETVGLEDAYGRILAEDAVSDIDIPGFDKSWKDGYAVIAAETVTATDSMPVMLRLAGRIPMGVGEDRSIVKGECLNIPTGGRMPAGADAVVMLEYTDEVAGDILVKRPVAPGENVIYAGEDFKKDSVVYKAGKVLTASDIGALAAIGYARVPVKRKPVIGIISTGIEIVDVDTVPEIGQIRDVNSYLCSAFAKKYGCIPKRLGIVRDDCEEMKALLKEAKDKCDLILVSGGSSKDLKDVTAQAIYGVGEVLVHGIALAPGKPTIIGKIGETPIVGIPGHPAATYMVLSVLVRHMLRRLCGLEKDISTLKSAKLSTNIASEKGREEYVRVRITEDGLAEPLFGKSGLLNTIVESDGVVKVPAGCEGLEAGEFVEVFMW